MTSSSSSSKKSALTPSVSATSTIASSSASSSAGTSGGESASGAGNSNSGFQVPLTHDSLTFDARQAARLKEIEKRIDEELRKRRSEWKRDMAHMREEIIQLHPVSGSAANDSTESAGEVRAKNESQKDNADAGSSDDSAADAEQPLEPFIARRRGSTDVLDAQKMRTLYLEYPDAGRRCKMRFDVTGMDPDQLEVTTDGERIIVRGTRLEYENSVDDADDDSPAQHQQPEKPTNPDNTCVINGSSNEIEVTDETHGEENDDESDSPAVPARQAKVVTRHFVRKIEKPKDVDHTKLRSSLTTDGILVVEAPLPPGSLNLRCRSGLGSPRSANSANSDKNGIQHANDGRHQLSHANEGLGGSGTGGTLSCSSSANSGLSSRQMRNSPSRGQGNGGGGIASPGGASVSSSGTAHSSTVTASGSGSTTTGQPAAVNTLQFARELYGIPTFRDSSDGRRRMFLVVDLGNMFTAKEVTVQIIKDNRIQIKARHEERTSERLSRAKFSKDYELHERVESYSLRGGLTPDGRLMIAALVKPSHSKSASSGGDAPPPRLSKAVAGEMIADELNTLADNEPCNVLDLSTFPPTTAAIISGGSSTASAMTTSMSSSASSSG